MGDTMKIYIIGPVGSGKSTLAKKLSQESNIPYIELDGIVWNKNNIKRCEEEIKDLFSNILKKEDYIIEDVGRNIFSEGINNSDIIIYLNINKYILRYRVIKRWLNQRKGIEYALYKPNIKMLLKMFGWLKSGIKKRKKYLLYLKEQSKKLIVLDRKQLNNFSYKDIS